MTVEKDICFVRYIFGYTSAIFEAESFTMPSGLQVMRVFFNHIENKKTVAESARLTARLLRHHYLSSGTVAVGEDAIVFRLKSLYGKFGKLRKQYRRGGDLFDSRVRVFKETLANLLDVSKPDAGVPDRAAKRRAATLANGRKPKKRVLTQHKFEDLESSDTHEDKEDEDDPSYEVEMSKPEHETVSSLQLDLSKNAEFLNNLDRCKLSSRDACRTTASTLIGSGQILEGKRCSRTSLQRGRCQNRKEQGDRQRADFRPETPLTVHWDGIKMCSLEGKTVVERLPVVVTGVGIDQLLSSWIIPQGTGEAQAGEVARTLEDWKCTEFVACMCSDSTSSNTGCHKGAAVLIERALGRELIYLVCRHHVLELIPKSLFDKMVETSSSPDLGTLCKNFQQAWTSIDQAQYTPASEDPLATTVLTDERVSNILSFVQTTLQRPQIRADYKYLLELTVLFVGGEPTRARPFRPPIALSSARFMGRIIYCLSIYMFSLSGQFKIPAEKLNKIRDLCLFVVTTYLKPWFTATDPVVAPRTDLELLHNIIAYKDINSVVSEIALKAFSNHFWYFSEQVVPLALFDSELDINVKRNMVINLNCPERGPSSKRYKISAKAGPTIDILKEISLDFFVSSESNDFFRKLSINTDFLSEDTSKWDECPTFQNALVKVKAIHVVNDIAERAVALTKDYNCGLTKKEDDFQNLLLVVKKARAQENVSIKSEN